MVCLDLCGQLPVGLLRPRRIDVAGSQPRNDISDADLLITRCQKGGRGVAADKNNICFKLRKDGSLQKRRFEVTSQRSTPGFMMMRSESGTISNSSSIFLCCALTHIFVSKVLGNFWNSLTSSAILMASGRIPNTVNILFGIKRLASLLDFCVIKDTDSLYIALQKGITLINCRLILSKLLHSNILNG